MLETIREYAGEELARSGVAEATKSRHARYFLRLAEEQHPHQQADQVPALRQLAAEHGNLRAALSWALEVGWERARPPARHDARTLLERARPNGGAGLARARPRLCA